MVVVKNRIVVLKSWLILKGLCNNMTDKLRQNWSLSSVSLTITTEDRLLHAAPNDFHLHLKLAGKMIYGKDLIAMMPRYGYNEYKLVPASELKFSVFAMMVKVVRSLASSGIIDGNVGVNGYNSVLKSIRKLTLFMLRNIIIIEGIPLNPYDLAEIKTKCKLYEIKNAELYVDLLKSHEDIKLIDSNEDFSMVEIERCLARVIKQLNSTIEFITGTKNPFSLPKKIIFGQTPLIHRMERSIYILVINLRSGWSMDLIKYVIATIFHYGDNTSRFYELFASSSDLIKSLREEGLTNNQQRQSWLNIYAKTFKGWKYIVE